METQGGRKPLNQLTDEEVRERHALFNKYVTPNLNLIYKCVIQYSMDKRYIDDNYVEALVNYYNYIDTYDPCRPLATWLHIVCKRFVHNLEMRRSKETKSTDDVEIDNSPELSYNPQDISENVLGVDNWRELYDDDILWALETLKPIYREAFILQQAGYKLNEIVEISYQNGNLRSRNIDTIKSRLFLAKLQLQALLTRDGKRRVNQEVC